MALRVLQEALPREASPEGRVGEAAGRLAAAPGAAALAVEHLEEPLVQMPGRRGGPPVQQRRLVRAEEAAAPDLEGLREPAVRPLLAFHGVSRSYSQIVSPRAPVLQ